MLLDEGVLHPSQHALVNVLAEQEPPHVLQLLPKFVVLCLDPGRRPSPSVKRSHPRTGSLEQRERRGAHASSPPPDSPKLEHDECPIPGWKSAGVHTELKQMWSSRVKLSCFEASLAVCVYKETERTGLHRGQAFPGCLAAVQSLKPGPPVIPASSKALKARLHFPHRPGVLSSGWRSLCRGHRDSILAALCQTLEQQVCHKTCSICGLARPCESGVALKFLPA